MAVSGLVLAKFGWAGNEMIDQQVQKQSFEMQHQGALQAMQSYAKTYKDIHGTPLTPEQTH